jgi:hypothetical protein
MIIGRAALRLNGFVRRMVDPSAKTVQESQFIGAEPDKPNDPVGPESKNPGATGARTAGHIVHDDRGNAVWKWGEDAARSDSTSRVLRRLDVPDLKIEGPEEPAWARDKGQAAIMGQPKTNQHNTPKAQTRAPMVDAGGGYNPYNLTVPVKKQGGSKIAAPPKGSDRR